LPAACARAGGLGWRPTRGLGRAGASELGRDACGGGLAALRAGPSGAGALGRDAHRPTRERVGAGENWELGRALAGPRERGLARWAEGGEREGEGGVGGLAEMGQGGRLG
jgi:hypothetical protein